MSLKAAVRPVGDVSIVDLSGRVTLGEGSGLVRSTIKELVNSGRKNILLNLKDVTYIDSAGLVLLDGEEVHLRQLLRRIGLGEPPLFHDLIIISGVAPTFSRPCRHSCFTAYLFATRWIAFTSFRYGGSGPSIASHSPSRHV